IPGSDVLPRRQPAREPRSRAFACRVRARGRPGRTRRPAAPAVVSTRAAVGGVAVGIAVGWNIADVGAIATRLSHAYHTDLATIGRFTTALFLVHMVTQIPGGRAAARFGARPTALVGTVLSAAGRAIATGGSPVL